MTIVPITSKELDAVEVSWFSALCSDDFQYLGVPDGTLRSSWGHCSNIRAVVGRRPQDVERVPGPRRDAPLAVSADLVASAQIGDGALRRDPAEPCARRSVENDVLLRRRRGEIVPAVARGGARLARVEPPLRRGIEKRLSCEFTRQHAACRRPTSTAWRRRSLAPSSSTPSSLTGDRARAAPCRLSETLTNRGDPCPSWRPRARASNNSVASS